MRCLAPGFGRLTAAAAARYGAVGRTCDEGSVCNLAANGRCGGFGTFLRKRNGARSLGCCRRHLGPLVLAGLLAAPVPRIAEAEHVIAVVATQGSVHQPHGGEIIAGVTGAVTRINAEGGVLGQSLRVASWTEDCSRDGAVQVAEEIVQFAPRVVIGHLCASAAMAAAGIYAKAGVLLIAPGVRHPGLTRPENGALVLRLAGRDDRFAVEAVRFIKARHAGQAVAVIGDRTRQASALADGVAAELRWQRIVMPVDARIESGERSYSALAQRLRASGVGVVVMPAQPIELGVLIHSLRRAGVDAPVIGSEILAVPAVEAIAREQARKLVVMLPWTGLEEEGRGRTLPPDGGVAPDAQREAVRRQAEAAAELWAATAKRAGTTDAPAVAAAARSRATPTVVGRLRFDAAGDALVPSYVPSVWLNGGWRRFGD